MENQYWNNATKKMKLGVAFATMLLVLYNVLLFFPMRSLSENGTIKTDTLLYMVIFVIAALALTYFCIRNYTRGLSRMAVVFEGGGKRSLFLIRWGFLLTIAGVVLQLFVFFILRPDLESITFLRMIIGNILLVAGAVVGIVGFLSLATSKGMPDDSRRGALHMSWTTVVMFIGACLLSYANQAHVTLKIVAVIVNLFGTYFFYINWKRILSPKDPEKPVIESDETDKPAPEKEA